MAMQCNSIARRSVVGAMELDEEQDKELDEEMVKVLVEGLVMEHFEVLDEVLVECKPWMSADFMQKLGKWNIDVVEKHVR